MLKTQDLNAGFDRSNIGIKHSPYVSYPIITQAYGLSDHDTFYVNAILQTILFLPEKFFLARYLISVNSAK